MRRLLLSPGEHEVSVPGVDREVAQELAEAAPGAHGICPYSKAVHGNIEVESTVI